MLTFAHPWFLLALPLAGLVGWLWRRARHPAMRYSDISLFDGLPRGRAAWWPTVTLILRVVIIASLIVAAAGPRIPDGRTRLAVDGIAIAIGLDVSGSMAEADFPVPNAPPISRLRAAQSTLKRFIDGGDGPDGVTLKGRPDDLLGVVAFAAWPEAVCPLTLDRPVVLSILDQLKPKSGPDAGTNIGDALAECLIRLESTGPRRKVIVLLSDGEHNIALDRADPPLKPRQAAQLAADLTVPIYAIDCGGVVMNDPESIERRATGRASLDAIAGMTGGRAFVANDLVELSQAVAEIDRLERRPAESFLYRRYHELAVWCGAFAFACLMILFVMESVIGRMLPL